MPWLFKASGASHKVQNSHVVNEERYLADTLKHYKCIKKCNKHTISIIIRNTSSELKFKYRGGTTTGNYSVPAGYCTTRQGQHYPDPAGYYFKSVRIRGRMTPRVVLQRWPLDKVQHCISLVGNIYGNLPRDGVSSHETRRHLAIGLLTD